MQLANQQSEKIFREHGSSVNECCDRCGKVLMWMRFTLRGAVLERRELLRRQAENQVKYVDAGKATVAGGMTTAEIPAVFQRMPADLLLRYSKHGVVGAREELRRRRTEQAKVAAAPKGEEKGTQG